MKISYYDLLGMIKENNIPRIIEYRGVRYASMYDYMGNFTHYGLVNEDDLKKDECLNSYLCENLLESDMFEQELLIPNNKLEKIHYSRIKLMKNVSTLDDEIVADCLGDMQNVLNMVVDRINKYEGNI